MSRRLCEGGCGRWLTTPESVALGYGRVCAERHSIPTGRRTVPARPAPARVAEPAVAHCDGQTELPLVDHQPTLWSL